MDHPITPLKTIGLIGGSTSQATHEYYRRFNVGINQALGGHEAAEVLIASMNFGVIDRLLKADRWDELGDYVADKALRLERGGADFLMLVSHTLHKVAHCIVAATNLPFLDMLEVTAEALRGRGLNRVGLLGTSYTMTDPFYRNRYAGLGVEVIVPEPDARHQVNRVIFEELSCGHINPGSRTLYHRVVDELVEAGAQGVILGCTEITLLVGGDDFGGLPVLDPTVLHTAKAVELSLGRLPERADRSNSS